MDAWSNISIYRGEGKTIAERGQRPPEFNESGWKRQHDPAGYEADEGLRDAVNVALLLGLPLLITGEAGTGKTELAHSVAWELGTFPPLVFNTKSTSTYTDLLYRYDALAHFQDVHIRQGSDGANRPVQAELPIDKQVEFPVEKYIRYEPLGEAILIAADRSDEAIPERYRQLKQRRSVVLIDEIDKAPRDLPNDLLNELQYMRFEVRELRHTFQAEQKYRPILILTSNLEKDLPEAFRRRCAFYHIEFPRGDDKGRSRLISIIRRRLPKVERYTPEMLYNAVSLFCRARELKLEKKPSTAELINWVDMLQRIALDVKDGRTLSKQDSDILAASFALLAKSDDDLRELKAAFAPQTAAPNEKRHAGPDTAV
jgi:MoxR-like ATPase